MTELAAIAAGRWVGRRDKAGADAAAVAAMRSMTTTVAMDGVVVIGEGEKDQALMLYNGVRVGSGAGVACDVAVDPVDGTTLTAKGVSNAVSVLAVHSNRSRQAAYWIDYGRVLARVRGRYDDAVIASGAFGPVVPAS